MDCNVPEYVMKQRTQKETIPLRLQVKMGGQSLHKEYTLLGRFADKAHLAALTDASPTQAAVFFQPCCNN